MDQNRAADEAFHTSYRQTHPPTSATRLLTPLCSVLTAPPVHFAHSNLSPGNPIPMDIDAARKNKTAPDTQYFILHPLVRKDSKNSPSSLSSPRTVQVESEDSPMSFKISPKKNFAESEQSPRTV